MIPPPLLPPPFPRTDAMSPSPSLGLDALYTALAAFLATFSWNERKAFQQVQQQRQQQQAGAPVGQAKAGPTGASGPGQAQGEGEGQRPGAP